MKKFRLTAIILAAVMCITALGTLGASAAEVDYAYDVNGDGENDTKDLTRLMKVIAGEGAEAAVTDMNGDGAVNTKDITRLMKFLAGGELGSESAFKKTYNALVNWTMNEGVFEEIDPETGTGIYSVYKEGYTSEGEVYSVGIAYAPVENSIMIAYTGLGGVDPTFRGELLDAITIMVTPESESSKTADYVYLFDNETLVDLGCAIVGDFNMGDIQIDGYVDAYLGNWDEAQMLDYTEKLINYTLVKANEVVPTGINLWDLGFSLN